MSKCVEHLNNLLGKHAVDVVTGFAGVVSTVSFDLYGCIQAVLTPAVDEKGEMKDGRWFDINRLSLQSEYPVMQIPDFISGDIADGNHGPAEKPKM